MNEHWTAKQPFLFLAFPLDPVRNIEDLLTQPLSSKNGKLFKSNLHFNAYKRSRKSSHAMCQAMLVATLHHHPPEYDTLV